MILAVLQARLSSRRLPGKVLKPILGTPMLLHQIRRIERTKLIDKLVVATSEDQTDDPIAALCDANNMTCFRGALDDVLDRFYNAARPYNPKHVVRLTGDCPLTDPEIIDKVIKLHLECGNDYTSNALEPTFPDGLDNEAVKFSVLSEAWRKADTQAQREHVTLYITHNRNEFKCGCLRSEEDLSSLRWTVDEPQDFKFVSDIYENLYPVKADFNYHDILQFLRIHPEIAAVNSQFIRNQGLIDSLSADSKIKR